MHLRKNLLRFFEVEDRSILFQILNKVKRNAVSLGGDADTQAAIAGSIAIATTGWTIPQAWYDRAYAKVSEIFRQIMDNFAERYDV